MSLLPDGSDLDCHECNGLGYVNCFCGGDQCVCGMEDMPCHTCYPGHYTQDEDETAALPVDGRWNSEEGGKDALQD